MRSPLSSILLAALALAVFFDHNPAFARGGGRGGGGGGRGGGGFSRSSGGGSFSRPSGGSNFSSGSYSRPSGGSSYSGGSGFSSGNYSRPSSLPSGGRVPSSPAQRPANGSFGGSMTQLPAYGAASRLPSGNRPAQPPAGRPGVAARPGTGAVAGNRPATQPARPGAGGNFLGAGGVAGAGQRPAQLPAKPARPANPAIAGQLPSGRSSLANRSAAAQRPEQRPNWNQRSQNRNQPWQQRVDSRSTAWNNWQQNNQTRLNNFQNNQEQRWNHLDSARNDRQNWRNQNREDWQKHREDLWDYRADRADDVRDHVRDLYDDVFDDHWWGSVGWGYYYGYGSYPADPWWWWAPATYESAEVFVEGVSSEPVYIDYGMNVIYEDETVYVDNQPIPAEQYTQPMINLATQIEQPPLPAPPAEGQQPEWLPLGVFALAQEEKGDPIMFFQLSVSRAGLLSGGYTSVLTDDERPVAGEVDKTTQRVAWRIGENKETVFETSLANLTRDVSPVAIHFGARRSQTWLLVRMPEPAGAGKPAAIPEIDRKPPPLKSAPAKPPVAKPEKPATTPPK